MHSASDMLTPLENPLGYLHKHLQQLLERQNNAKNNINTTLATLTIQLQQLIQLVENLSPALATNVPLQALSPPPIPPLVFTTT